MPQSRQLAVILFTDIVGYTELMQNDEVNALNIVNHFKKIIEARSPEYMGTIIQYYGDGCLVIFKSPLEAVSFAKTLQEDFGKSPQVPARIGIHLGDLVFKEGNIYGDSVNIASRIESMGVAGSVLLSETVNNQIINHTEFKTTSLGDFMFKNVAKPIQVFALSNEGFPIPKRRKIEGKLRKKNDRKFLLISVLALLILSAGTWFIWRTLNPQEISSEIDPSIAVLPFTDMSVGHDQGYLGDGLAEEIINALNRIPGLQIAGRTSSFGYRGKKTDLKQIGKELDVGVILEGSVQKSGNTVRITAQLINTQNGFHLWSEHYDREIKDIFIIQDEIAKNITERLRLTFSEGLQVGRNKSAKANPQAYEMYLKGMYHLNGDQTEFDKAIPYFENAIRLDSTYALAYAMLAYSYARMGWWDVMTPRDAFEKMYALSRKSIELDPQLAMGYAVLASALLHSSYNWKGAKENFEISFRLDSLNPVALNEYAYYNIYSGEYEAGIHLAETNLALDPSNSFYLTDLGNMYFHSGKSELASKIYRRIRELYPDKVDGYFEQYRLFANQNQFDSAQYYYQAAVLRGLKEKTKNTLFEVSRLVQEGKQKEALAVFVQNKNAVKSFDKAIIYALLNQFDDMMENLEISYLERDDDLLAIKTIKEFKRFASDPMFVQFIAKLNFPPKE